MKYTHKNWKKEGIFNISIHELFIVFATYLGLLLVALTELLGQWSGIASLGTFYLLIGAPIAMGIIGYKYRKIRGNSKYHNWLYFAGLLYFIIAPLTFLFLLLIGN